MPGFFNQIVTFQPSERFGEKSFDNLFWKILNLKQMLEASNFKTWL